LACLKLGVVKVLAFLKLGLVVWPQNHQDEGFSVGASKPSLETQRDKDDTLGQSNRQDKAV
jgi:hypothetical protein